MKADIIFFGTIVFAFILLAVSYVYVAPVFKKHIANATNQFQVYSPRPGIECLVVNSSDGVAVSCYEVKPE